MIIPDKGLTLLKPDKSFIFSIYLSFNFIDSKIVNMAMFITTYIILLYKCVIWYMALPSPTLEQSGLISIVVGAGAAWFGLYAGTSKK